MSLVRIVIRIPPEMRGEIAKVSARFFEETGKRHHRATIIRGVILAGLASLDRSESIAAFFEGMSFARGRKKRVPLNE